MIFEWVEADRGCVMLIDEETGELEPDGRRDRKKQFGSEIRWRSAGPSSTT